MTAVDVDLSVEAVEARIGVPFVKWYHQCHSISLAMVKAKMFPEARVARGSCDTVRGQHSWVVLGTDVYDRDAQIVDPTLFSYDPTVNGIWTGTLADGRHRPHGHGSIWDFGRPPPATADPVALTPKTPLSQDAALFVDILGPLDHHGWAYLVNHCPMGDWPAAEIIAAIDDTESLSMLIPIDILGMLTDRNPGGLYLPGDEKPS